MKRTLGRLDWQVFPIGFGGASISGEGGGYGFGMISESDAIALLQTAFERGINVFDTAPIYGFGESERRIGKAFKSIRDQVYIVSKSGVTWDRHRRVDMSNDPKVTTTMLEQSLKDLSSDYIDLYMVHWPDARVDIRKPLEVLRRAQDQGKIRTLGLCNTNPEDLAKAKEIGRIDVIQSELSLFERRNEGLLFDDIRSDGYGFMSWGTLDKGILTGRVTPDRKYDSKDARSHAPWWKQADRTWKFKAMDEITPLLSSEGYSGINLALSHVLDFDEVSVALCGAKSVEQLSSLLDAFDHPLPADLLERCREIAKRHRPQEN